MGGVVASYSSSKSMNPEIPFYALMFKNIALELVLVYNMAESAKASARDDLYRALAEDRLVHRVAKTFPLEDTAKAHELVERGGVDGCVVVEIS